MPDWMKKMINSGFTEIFNILIDMNVLMGPLKFSYKRIQTTVKQGMVQTDRYTVRFVEKLLRLSSGFFASTVEQKNQENLITISMHSYKIYHNSPFRNKLYSYEEYQLTNDFWLENRDFCDNLHVYLKVKNKVFQSFKANLKPNISK